MKNLLFTIVAFTTSFISYSQSVFQEDILQGEKLIEAYFTPIAKSFGASLNNGWYNTAKPHKLGGFDVTFTLNTVIIPNSAESFKIKDSFGNIFTSNAAEASTIFGNNEETEMTYINSNTGIEYEFDMPGGLKIHAFPLPMIQAGIGLIKKTAIDIRYMPMLNISNNININLLGFGVKHDLLQWIPLMGDAIPISLSIQGGYTSLNTELKISDQDVELKTNATTINLIASKKILMITGYAGIGYNSATTTFTSQTKFNLDGIIFEEKIETSFESNKNLRTNIGLRLNLTIITIQADYTFSEYPTTTIGIGVSLR